MTRLLISDVDDTILGDVAATERFFDYCEANRNDLKLVYASGRFVDSIREDVDAGRLPVPDIVIGGVGCEIHQFSSGAIVDEWSSTFKKNWSVSVIRNLLRDQPDLTLQPETFQSELKLSYFLHDATPERLATLRSQLTAAGIASELIYSSNRDLDLMPLGINKGTAAAFVVDKILNLPPDRVIVSGNSGNDITLFQHQFRGIVVANAHDELKRLATSDSVYLSPLAFADGVIDGLKFWQSRQ